MLGPAPGPVGDVLGDRELLVASNREPYVHSFDGDAVTVSRRVGGLTAVLDRVMRQLGGTWVAWGSGDADFAVTDDRGRIEVPPEDPSYTLQRLALDDGALAGAHGYSDRVLWPLCHATPRRADDGSDVWRDYRQVNETFADALEGCARSEDPTVWFHGNHLALAPRLLRERLPGAFRTHFWPAPWPSWSTFRSCPQRRQLLAGLLGNDLLGFQDEAHCEALRECVAAVFDDVTVDDEQVTYDGHTTRVRSTPLPVDAERADATGRSQRCRSRPVSVWSGARRLLEDLRDADGLFVMTDFDGTVSDIVTDPDRAAMRERARAALETLSAHPRVAVGLVSGRGVDDLRERTDVEGAYYAGNHGFEVFDGEAVSTPDGVEPALALLPAVCDALEERFDDAGVAVEEKGATATVHHRESERGGDEVHQAVRAVLDECDEEDLLRTTTGKQVVEVRPAVDWDKGSAAELFLRRFTPDGETWLPLYLGDDTTDEAVFEVLDRGEGLDGYGVAVGSDTAPTAARYVVSDPGEVTDLLEWLATTGIEELATGRPSDASET
jgi:trehalose-phosphatase